MSDWIDQCKARCKKIKYASEHLQWDEKPNRSGYLVATSDLVDESGVTIPNLYLKGEYRQLTRKRGEVFSISLQYYWLPDELRRVFMIESYPITVRSHIDDNVGEIFGPHLHLGDDRLEQVVKAIPVGEDGLPLSRWINRFVRHARTLSPDGNHPEGPFGIGLL